MQEFRSQIYEMKKWTEQQTLKHLLSSNKISEKLRGKITDRAIELVERIRDDSDPSLMELFLGEYGLSSEEGIALMCLAEALLRVPDAETIDALIEDKIAPNQWDKHLGQSHSSLINASTWALFMTGKVLNDEHESGISGVLQSAIKRLGEPVIRQAVTRVMKELGQQFVLGENIDSAMKRAEELEAKGFRYSYDMLGEAALTEKDAKRYYLAYAEAIANIAKASKSEDISKNPGISIKLSALHPRYETLKKKRVMEELMPRARSLAVMAKSAGIGLNIDAEEAGRLDISLDLIEAILSDPTLNDWDGFGVVVQAYGKRASAVIEWLYQLAKKLNRKFMVRLVKGAYWDTEIKHAQVEGLENFPVFTRKESTDVSYICCAQKLLGMTDRLYPQFATHNAHTVAAILEMAEDKKAFEFQRLHGMGEALHDTVLRRQSTRCRIYAPVGAHKDLLAYLVRRLLENGANSSFVNQIVDEGVAPEEVAADPFLKVEAYIENPENPYINQPKNIFAPERANSKGWDLEDPIILENLQNEIAKFRSLHWDFKSNGSKNIQTVSNPANGNFVGEVSFASEKEVDEAISKLKVWTNITPKNRADILRKAANLFEENSSEIFALLMQEAGKTLLDCVGELREAVDFLRYYAMQAEQNESDAAGIFACISPWNFPLAIFTGQVSAALAAGNAVIAKPAETTPLIAILAVRLMKEAGIPDSALQLIIGTGAIVGTKMTSHSNVDGVCFTGSTATAQIINRNMSKHLVPHAPLIAETGGLNAMIVDSTALPEQAITDIIASAFQSTGQRCSALRLLYLQEDIAEFFIEMLRGAMNELEIGNPQNFTTDIGPAIDNDAKQKIEYHIEAARKNGRLIEHINAPKIGNFVGPALLRINGIADLKEEIFGPVLHIATYAQQDFENIIKEINKTGHGLTFGMHSRIDERVEMAIDSVNAGNIYINRNQIGAVVGSQPFGGEGLSGTGPKAGGPKYLDRFYKVVPNCHAQIEGKEIDLLEIQNAFEQAEKTADGSPDPIQWPATELPGPTGESNQYSLHPRGRILCLGPNPDQAEKQMKEAQRMGCVAVAVAPGMRNGLDGVVSESVLLKLEKLSAVISWSDNVRLIRQTLAKRNGAIVPLHTQSSFAKWLSTEKHVCIDTTAAGGNAALLAG